MADEIIEELWKIKDSIACEYGYNLDLLVAYLRTKAHSANQKIIQLHCLNESAEKNITKANDEKK
ncbi:MAG: hypothetical protein HQK77_08770 [Desulfobacterales bacterium]|nr:hypothetical protein [Desulfobacterales bacterium]